MRVLLAAGRRLVPYTAHLFFDLQKVDIKKLVCGDAEKQRDGGYHRRVRHRRAVLPLAYRLKGHAQILGQYLLREASLLPERLDFFP